MILGQVSWLDCVVFLLCLAPQLIIHVGFFPTLFCGIQALPFLLVRLPLGFLYDHLILEKSRRSPFVQQASWFEDLVIRCVRYAFAYIPANIGRVFFSKLVALPFLRFRMLRHGYFSSPIYWQEIEREGFKGLWIIHDPTKEPDIVIYYAHGGGFSMGSCYFYLEFLLAFISLLKTKSQFRNPAILAVEYTLVPDAPYPTQLHQVMAGYIYLISITKNPSQIVVSGDSAGGTLILSLLLHLSKDDKGRNRNLAFSNGEIPPAETNLEPIRPGLAILISPWTTLLSPLHKNTSSDYLDVDQLNEYASQYCRNHVSANDPLVSPGKCKDVSWWRRAAPKHGFFITYGAEEVFAPEIRRLVSTLTLDAEIQVEKREREGGIHAWPVASLFLSSTKNLRLRGLEEVVAQIEDKMGATHYVTKKLAM